ncbi:hypothetical protein ACQ4M4_27520 [Leptolyngbya sp. AN02str]|uniref:hypothetical protein n=1 Tax=Leptolyngbya sp. AN02str TaxID=3423363 RepID=UPI003D3241FD
MNQLKEKLNLAAVGRMLAVCLAGVFLVMTTACSNPPVPKASGTGSYQGAPAPKASGTGGSYQEKRAQHTDIYGTNQDRVGGMNNFRDTPGNLDTSRSDAKADRLIRNANQNLNKANNPEEFVENFQEGRPLNERISNVSKRVGSGVENATEELSETARKGFKNVQKNAKNAADEVSKAVDDDTPGGPLDRLGNMVRDRDNMGNSASNKMQRNTGDSYRG